MQPIVLTGGRSRRFGRDKLREPASADSTEWLVDRPIAALRELFGRRVALVGHSHPDVAARGDLLIEDRYPGVGPAGGILSALEQQGDDVFVLAGDLPNITAEALKAIVEIAEQLALDGSRGAWAVLAGTPRIEPCIGVYRQGVRARLAERVAAGEFSLHDLVPTDRLVLVPIDAAIARNVNSPGDLSGR